MIQSTAELMMSSMMALSVRAGDLSDNEKILRKLKGHCLIELNHNYYWVELPDGTNQDEFIDRFESIKRALNDEIYRKFDK